MNFSNEAADMEADTSSSILGNWNGNLTVTMESDVGILATSYLIYKIGNVPFIINITVMNTLTKVHSSCFIMNVQVNF